MPTPKSPRVATPKVGWRIPEWSGATGVSNSTTNELIAAKRIDSVKLGWARIITTSPRDFLKTLAEKD